MPAPAEPVHISLRLERMALTDTEAGMVAEWCTSQAHVVLVRKLWLFDNRLGDEGAAAVAAMLHGRVLEVQFWTFSQSVGFRFRALDPGVRTLLNIPRHL